jgi:phosphatidylserine/phosphatidylglycerophosphate/cardiolipin synthase-like enzyme
VVTSPLDAYKKKGQAGLKGNVRLLKDAGVLLLFKANLHQKFAVIDQKIVWYGSINLLSYGSAQESLMRLESPNIAQELLKVISGKA